MNPLIILVDDDINVRQSIKRSLRNEPYKILCADSAHSCLELLAVTSPQVVISDLAMPGHDGLELIEYLKDERPEIVRVVLSGKLDLNMALDLINRCQVYRCLEKPCPTPLLALTIREAFKHAKLVAKTQRLINLVKKQSPRADLEANAQNLEHYDLETLIHDAVAEVERLDNVLDQRSAIKRKTTTEQGSL